MMRSCKIIIARFANGTFWLVNGNALFVNGTVRFVHVSVLFVLDVYQHVWGSVKRSFVGYGSRNNIRGKVKGVRLWNLTNWIFLMTPSDQSSFPIIIKILHMFCVHYQNLFFIIYNYLEWKKNVCKPGSRNTKKNDVHWFMNI